MTIGETILNVNGTICTDVVRWELPNGDAVVEFTVVSTERRFDKPTGKWVDGRRFLARVKCFRTLAENVYVSLRLGDAVMVSGRLRSQLSEQQGRIRVGPELDAFAIGPNLRNLSAQVRRTRGADSAELTTHDQAQPLEWQLGNRDSAAGEQPLGCDRTNY